MLVSAVSGLGKTLKELPRGYNSVVESDEPKKWAKKIRTMCENARALTNQEARELRTMYSNQHSWDDECSKLAKLFRDLVERSRVSMDTNGNYS